MSELLKNSLITSIELHAFCVILIVLLYENMRGSCKRVGRRVEISLTLVYAGSIMMIVSDCLWGTVSGFGSPGDAAAYIINIVYFIGSASAASCWFVFCAKRLELPFLENKILISIFMGPYIFVILLYLLSPWLGLIFSIHDGEYIRGRLFYFDPAIKMLYILLAATLAVIYSGRKDIEYQKKKDLVLVLFGAPVLVCGIFQIITGADFNCLGTTFGLVLVYTIGVTNPDSENTDAIYSMASSFEASYIVNMDTGLIRPLRQDIMHDESVPGMNSQDYTQHFHGVLSQILLAEDKADTLKTFDITNVAKRFKIDNSFNVRYRVHEPSGQTAIHTATFVHAAGEKGKQEFLLGINTIHSDSLLYERNENLSHENQRLEQINASIIESVAKIVEARDSESGEHVVRVRRFTELIAKEVMLECPEYNLDDEKINIIGSASVLHDIGKISIPDAILLKPGRLTAEEFEIMKTHTLKGCDALNMFPLGLDDAFLECALSICRWHHERYDGKGYPDGLKGNEIPIAAQLVSVADCFDALVSDRPYKKAYSPEKSFEMILNGECGTFSPEIISAFKKQRSKLTEFARLYK